MALDSEETISRLQSATVRNSLVLVVVNVLTVVAVVTGKTFDIEAVKSAMELGLPLVINVGSVWWGWKSYKGRVEAESKIEPLPWLAEIKSMKGNV